jgi:hypothetical protein
MEFKKNSGLNIVGIGYTVYAGSEYESQMLSEAAQLIYDAHFNGLITVVWAYPRGKAVTDEKDPHLVAGAASVTACLGSDFVKVKEQLAREHTLSAKILKNDFDEYVKNNDLSELAYQEKLQEYHERLRLEQEYFDAIKNNPDDFKDDKLKIATHPVLHGQIRYYFINKDGVKEDVQKHLSSELPNILIFDENSGSKKRKDNKIDIFLRNSIRIFGNVYMKKD